MFVNFGICFTKSKKMSYFTVIYNTHSLNVFTWIILCIFIFVSLFYINFFFKSHFFFTNYLCALLLLHGANFVHVIDDLIIILLLLLWFAGGIIFINKFFFFFFFFVLISFESGLVENKTKLQDLNIFCDVCPVKNKFFYFDLDSLNLQFAHFRFHLVAMLIPHHSGACKSLKWYIGVCY